MIAFCSTYDTYGERFGLKIQPFVQKPVIGNDIYIRKDAVTQSLAWQHLRSKLMPMHFI